MTAPDAPAPVELPLFSVRSLLLPDATLRPKAFEARSRDLVGRCHAGSTSACAAMAF